MKKVNVFTIDSTSVRSDLCDLGVKYPTDKSPYNDEAVAQTKNSSKHRHAYTAIYDLIFCQKRSMPVVLGEIGVLDNMSIQCWRNYFPSAKLYGFDNNHALLKDAKQHGLDNTTYVHLDVKNEKNLRQVFSDCRESFDILVDDSTHDFHDQVRIIRTCRPYMKSGGLIVVEDVFKHIPMEDYTNQLKDIAHEFSLITFIDADHKKRFSGSWNNDRLLILCKK